MKLGRVIMSASLVLLSLSTPLPGFPHYYWEVSSGSWHTASNWNPDRTTPTPNDHMVVRRSGGGTCKFYAANNTVGMLNVENGNILEHSNKTLEVLNHVYVGYDTGSGTYKLMGDDATLNALYVTVENGGQFTQSKGTCIFRAAVDIDGASEETKAVYNLTGGSLGDLDVDPCNAIWLQEFAELNQSGGTVEVENLFVGGYYNGDATYNLSGGSCVIPAPWGDNAYIGYYQGADGEIVLSGTGSFSVIKTVYVGYRGIGTITQTGDTTSTLQMDLVIGDTSESQGLYDMSAGSCTVGQDLIIAKANGAKAEFEISGGNLVVNRDVKIADGVTTDSTDIIFDIQSAAADLVKIAGDLVFGEEATLQVASGGTITMTGADSDVKIDTGASGTKLSGLGNLKLAFVEEDSGAYLKTIEAAGEDKLDELPGDTEFTAANFTLYELIVGDSEGIGPITLELKNDYDNVTAGTSEAVYVKTLTMRPRGKIDPSGADLYYIEEGTTNHVCRYYEGDRNLDGFVGQTDLDIVLDQWGKSGGEITDFRADANGDGFVGQTDLDYVLDDWGSSGGKGGEESKEGGGRESGDPTVEIVEVDNSSVPELSDYVTQDIVVTTTTDWLSSQMILETDVDGDIYQHPYGSWYPPNPAWFELFPALEFDTYVSDGDSGTPNAGSPVDLYGGPCSMVFDDQLLQIEWDTTDDDQTGELPLARITLADDATGDWSFVVTASPAEGPKTLVTGTIVDGEMIPDE